jgi:hypothetical protein
MELAQMPESLYNNVPFEDQGEIEEFPGEWGDEFESSEDGADAEWIASAGMGTDEDYGDYGPELFNDDGWDM